MQEVKIKELLFLVKAFERLPANSLFPRLGKFI